MTARKVFIYLLAVVIIYGCSKEVGEFLLGPYKAYNPMSGNETLTFLSSGGDTIKFYGAGRYSETIKTSEGDGDDYWVNEIDYCSFNTKNEQYILRYVLATYKDRAVEMNLEYYEQIGIDTFYFAKSLYSLPPREDDTFPKMFLDSLQVFDQHYFEVYVDHHLLKPNTPISEDQVIAIYYTKDQGIIKIDFKDDSYWGLIQVFKP